MARGSCEDRCQAMNAARPGPASLARGGFRLRTRERPPSSPLPGPAGTVVRYNGVRRFDMPDWSAALSRLGELEKVEVTVESKSKRSVSSHGTQEGNALSEYTRGNVARRINF